METQLTISEAQLQSMASHEFNLRPDELFKKTNRRQYTNARYVYWLFARVLLKKGPSDLAQESLFSHSSICIATKRATEWYRYDREFRELINRIANKLHIDIKEVI